MCQSYILKYKAKSLQNQKKDSQVSYAMDKKLKREKSLKQLKHNSSK